MKKARPTIAATKASQETPQTYMSGRLKSSILAGGSLLAALGAATGALMISTDIPYSRARPGFSTFVWAVAAVGTIQALFMSIRAYRIWKHHPRPTETPQDSSVWPPPPTDPQTGQPLPPPT